MKFLVANLRIFNSSVNYREGQKVKELDGKWYVGTVKVKEHIGTGGWKTYDFVPDNLGAYKRAMDVDYNYNLYKESVFERAQKSNKNPTAQQIQGKIFHDAPWPYKMKALKDYIATPSSGREYLKQFYIISGQSQGFDPEATK